MNRNQAIDSLKSLLRIDSVEREAEPGKPFGAGVYACLEKALDILKGEGFAVKNGNGYYGYGEIGEGELFGILTHLDVVPVGKGWTYDPFGATEENGKIYARGALDDKAPFIACLLAVSTLLREGLKPKKRIRFILGCDEESGWQCMDAYTRNEEMPALGISPDGDFPVINCEKGIVYHEIRYPKPANIVYIKSGERANMVPDQAEAKVIIGGKEVVISTSGIAAHGSHPESGKNALVDLLGQLSDNAICRELYEAFSSYNGSGVDLDISDDVSGGLSLNLGTARTEGDELVFELDVRHPVTYNKEYVTEKLTHKLSGKVTQGFYHLPLYVDKDSDLVKSLMKAYNDVTGENAEPIAIGGGTYARVLPMGVAFGPCFPKSPAGIHCADEYIDLAEFDRAVQIYYAAFKTLLF